MGSSVGDSDFRSDFRYSQPYHAAGARVRRFVFACLSNRVDRDDRPLCTNPASQ